jgi:hypothetical protein
MKITVFWDDLLDWWMPSDVFEEHMAPAFQIKK